MPDIVCDHCGGTTFSKEAGYYFCNGCQIQSQEVQEYVFDDYAAEHRTKTKKIHNEKSEKADNKITSWECYNYILLGLTEQLINLGADKRLKAVVRLLWLRYLEKLQVFKLGRDELPKLQAVCSAMDGEIVYGKLAKRKRKRHKSSSSEVDVTSLDSSSMKKERIKRKRALIRAQYDDFTQKSQGSASLHNETLTSLQTGSEKSSKNTVPISYNVYASKEMRRLKKSKFHWRRHRLDFNHNMKCHKVSYRKVSHKYRASPYILSINKLYSLLYLGLLILKDKIQLSDMLRFIKEGHLSFNSYSHFMPDEFSDKVLNFRNFKKHCLFSNAPFRAITSEMSSFLQIDYYISRPDLVELCERYCNELNLPQEISDCAKNIISKTEIKMFFRKRTIKVPNFEGRVLSIILFVIKLLFGLDDVTEFYLGNYSNILNRSQAVNPKMFNIVDWLKYIEYRDLVLTKHHFPTSFSKGPDVINVDLALSVLAKKEYPQTKFNPSKDNYQKVLGKLKDELDEPTSIEFPVTLTPFLDYAKLLPKENYLKILSENFTSHSIVHILRPSKFLDIVNKGVRPQTMNGGANDDWVVEKVICPQQDSKRDLAENRRLVTVKLTLDRRTKDKVLTKETEIDSGAFKDNFHAANAAFFSRNLRRLDNADMSNIEEFDLDKIREDLVASLETYPRHYNPYERFWMRTRVRIEALNQKECRKFLEKFPQNFLLVFRECQRIAQQTEQELLVEYQMTELHLVYLANYGKKTKEREVIKERLIANYLDKCTDLW